MDDTKSIAKKGGQNVGYSGHKRIKGSNIVVLSEGNGYPIACSEIVGANTVEINLVEPVLESLAYVKSEIEMKPCNTMQPCTEKQAIVNLDAGFAQ